jgi:hypothetical protein
MSEKNSSSRYNNVPDDPFDDIIRNGTEIFQFQIMLTQVLTFMLNNQKNYFVQFDEQRAW